MELILVLVILVNVLIHWHYYRWGVFNHSINIPAVYRGRVGVSIVIFTKLSFFTLIYIYYSWINVVIAIVALLLLKLLALRVSYVADINESIKEDGLNKDKAKKTALWWAKERFRKNFVSFKLII